MDIQVRMPPLTTASPRRFAAPLWGITITQERDNHVKRSRPSPVPLPQVGYSNRLPMQSTILTGLIDIPAIWERIEKVETRLMEASTTEDVFLTEISQHLLKAGGKRYRPLLTQLAGEFGPARDQRLIEAGASVELIHVGSIYHDDVIDHADIRRGAPSVNRKWGNAHAILAGDFLIARASELATDSLGMESVALLAQTYRELVEGQGLELSLTGSVNHGPREFYRVIGGKTASLIRTSARLGALAADATPAAVEAVSTATWELGMVFQLTDDALDLTASDEVLGKPAHNDLREGVYTLPVLHALGGPEGDRIKKLLVQPANLTDDELEEIISKVVDGGYVRQVLGECRTRLDRTYAALSALPDGPARSVFYRMGEFLLDRVPPA